MRDTEENPQAGAEHRTASRVRSFMRAEIIHSNGNSRTECTVRDLSDGGARIEAPASVTIPEFFELHIPMRSINTRARIMWRAGNELGVAFIKDSVKPATPSAPPTAPAYGMQDQDVRIKLLELEAETARLRAQLSEMQLLVTTLAKDRGAA